jgi:hypothetical protein
METAAGNDIAGLGNHAFDGGKAFDLTIQGGRERKRPKV